MLYVLNLGDDEAGQLYAAVERHKLGALQAVPTPRSLPFAAASKPSWPKWKKRKPRNCSSLTD